MNETSKIIVLSILQCGINDFQFYTFIKCSKRCAPGRIGQSVISSDEYVCYRVINCCIIITTLSLRDALVFCSVVSLSPPVPR